MSTGRMERVRTLLRTRAELCSLDAFYADALANARNDVSTLRRRGWEIESWWTQHEDGAGHKHYRLVAIAGGPPASLSWRAWDGRLSRQ